MTSHPQPDATATVSRQGPRWPLGFVACAGLIGAAGMGVGAAAAHGGGSDLARTAADFMLLHAAAIVAGSGVALAVEGLSVLFIGALGLLTVGTVLFGGELALAGLSAWRPVPLAAPTGGLCLVAGWLSLAIAALRIGRRIR